MPGTNAIQEILSFIKTCFPLFQLGDTPKWEYLTPSGKEWKERVVGDNGGGQRYQMREGSE